ncbi:MAG: DUF1801 domain-containing protein [Candidatus Bipolaricaulota bacterium]
MTHDVESIANYLKGLSIDQRNALERLRSVIRDAVPEARECMSYGVPALCLDGKPLVAYGATKKHCALYPLDPKLIEAQLPALTGLATSRGAIRFQPADPIPDAVVRAIVLARVASILRAG